MFVSFEGIDRSGKSTQARLLADALEGEVVRVREPGGTPAGERIRELLLDPAASLAPRSEALLYAAARAELCAAVIWPALGRGATVVSDRFIDSSLAYQGVARGLGIEAVERLNLWATDGLLPDLTVLVEVSPEAAAERGGAQRDRLEAEGIVLQRAVARGYAEVAARHPDRVVAVDGERPQSEVAAEVMRLFSERRRENVTASVGRAAP